MGSLPRVWVVPSLLAVILFVRFHRLEPQRLGPRGREVERRWLVGRGRVRAEGACAPGRPMTLSEAIAFALEEPREMAGG